ncbi:Unconventional myosin-Ic (Myosin I beta) (MMI-beta) (MMIb) (Myosin heavy chain myr 2) [Durusdinium trenchii]|uniref:Unconventional myosin-Ic (Myosin I beta) (MMI-beta) (MMIb) (Myosin heavy chain myr 2) n=1 Tax=Durusdinium trenchii TaxID=1381693 RepID=A0ABP0H9L9_9DINO
MPRRGFNIRKAVTAFYRQYVPEKMDDVDRVLTHFEGREDDLIETLEQKYSVTFLHDGSFEQTFIDDEEDDDEEDEYTYETDPDDSYDSEAEYLLPSDDDLDEDMEKEVDFSLKSSRDKQADLASAAAMIAAARPAPKIKVKSQANMGRVVDKTRSSKKLRNSVDSKGSKRSGGNGKKAGRSSRGRSSRGRPSRGVSSRAKMAGAKSGKKLLRDNKYKNDSALPTAREKAEHLSKRGTAVWVRDPDEAWVRGTIHGSDDGRIVVLLGRKTVTVEPVDVEPVLSAKDNLHRVQDLTKLPALHEPALLQALEDRFAKDKIYTFTGPILLAVNPFKTVNIYGTKQAQDYMEASKGFTSSEGGSLTAVALPPHAYKLADDAFRAMRDQNGCNQAILVSGESGAGKTETTKIVLNYLSYVTSVGRKRNKKANVSDRVLRANPVLEAFGNAKTIRNDNSSRFGKFIQLQFDPNKGSIKGAFIETYLLEKARVVHQQPGERNYHIFYELAAGASSEQKRRWHFPSSLKSCRYTGQSGTMTRSDIDDLAQFQLTIGAMEVLNFAPSDIERLFRAIVAVLHLGNVDYEESTNHEGMPTVRIVNPEESLLLAAELLEVDPDDLETVLTTRKIKIGLSETVQKPLSYEAAEDTRDALAMNLYERLFGWVVWRTNLSIGMDEKQYEAMLARQEQQRKFKERQRRRAADGEGGEDAEDPTMLYEDDGPGRSKTNLRQSLNRAFAQALNVSGLHANNKKKKTQELAYDNLIGCLDIFGFEVFETNSFEQLCINYTNEQLQQQFNEFVFQIEQIEYEREGIDWQFVSFPDNSGCIAMIESKPIGLLSLIDEECLYPKGSDATLIQKLHQNLPKKFPEHFIVAGSDRINLSFTVRHFAGDVTYAIDGFCVKNKNELQQEAVDLVRSSGDRLVSCLLPANAEAAAGGADMAAHFDSLLREGSSRRPARTGAVLLPTGNHSRILKKTVGSHFKTQLGKAMELIRSSEPHYIRCLKPNDENVPDVFDRNRMVNQLRYSGVLELVRVTRAGYPSRFPIAQFVERFAVLSYGLSSAAKKASDLVRSGNVKAQVKVCQKICDNAKLTYGQDYQIGRTKVFLRQATLAFLEMKKAERTYDAVVKIQRTFRKFRAEFRQRYYAQVIQRNVRGHLIRNKVDDALDQRAIAAEIIQTNPYFQRWLDGVMRRAAKRRRRARKRKGVTWQVPTWYTENREVLFWLLPIIGIYVIPFMVRTIFGFVFGSPSIIITGIILFGSAYVGAYGINNVDFPDPEAFFSRLELPANSGSRSRRKKSRAGTSRRHPYASRASKPPPKAKAKSRKGFGFRSTKKRGKAPSSKPPLRNTSKVVVPKAQVSEKFHMRAARLRDQKAKQRRRSQDFEMPVAVKISPRYRGLNVSRSRK